mmetsp:Transcript_70301/g.139338  ORF Transcript_70301/g.139338 Transcript_70301/m.139338 type:complete len:194 (-) Transcript_70301:97-678(-)
MKKTGFGSANASISQLQGGQFTITAREPSHVEAFYGTSNGEYKGHWHDGLPGYQAGQVPKISAVLGARPTIRKPVRPLTTTAKTILADQIRAESKAQEGEKVISADRMPKKFPVDHNNYSYPKVDKRGVGNPLYATSSQAYGSEPPVAHQVPDRYFPSTNKFTAGFVETKPRYSGLNCASSLSNVHKELDQRY